ncbi:efflux RND transporter permease subunit [Escherichia coli]
MNQKGHDLFEATLHACRQRLRPILMTSLAFIFGVLPMATSTGAGSGGQHAVGTGVMGGMISATILAIYSCRCSLCSSPLPAETAPGISNKKGDMLMCRLFNFPIKNLLSGFLLFVLCLRNYLRSITNSLPVPSSRSIITTSLIIMGILRKQYTVVKLIYSIAAMTTSGGQTLCKYYGAAVMICM